MYECELLRPQTDLVTVQEWVRVEGGRFNSRVDAVQEERFRGRLEDPTRRWTLSSMDRPSVARRAVYCRATDGMFVHTDLPAAPWNVVHRPSAERHTIRLNRHHRLS
ncbi:hypothetical protein ABZ721_37295 [Streptomyces sp. NPDC006733]|uniref:hypothetical protein n=1 Tax=Streptomyces sp. NPDC006733 TaxID=3155460 RepID=UPI0033CDDB6C